MNLIYPLVGSEATPSSQWWRTSFSCMTPRSLLPFPPFLCGHTLCSTGINRLLVCSTVQYRPKPVAVLCKLFLLRMLYRYENYIFICYFCYVLILIYAGCRTSATATPATAPRDPTTSGRCRSTSLTGVTTRPSTRAWPVATSCHPVQTSTSSKKVLALYRYCLIFFARINPNPLV